MRFPTFSHKIIQLLPVNWLLKAFSSNTGSSGYLLSPASFSLHVAGAFDSLMTSIRIWVPSETSHVAQGVRGQQGRISEYRLVSETNRSRVRTVRSRDVTVTTVYGLRGCEGNKSAPFVTIHGWFFGVFFSGHLRVQFHFLCSLLLIGFCQMSSFLCAWFLSVLFFVCFAFLLRSLAEFPWQICAKNFVDPPLMSKKINK